jgi:hypothetical protein
MASPTDLKRGTVVYARFVHLNTAKDFREKNQDIFECSMEGKYRPVLVLELFDEEYGPIRWYQVLKLTTQGLWKNGEKRSNLVGLGCILNKEKETFAERFPTSYPSNLMDGRILKQLGERLAGDIAKITLSAAILWRAQAEKKFLRIFLSTVSSEFRSYRDLLAADLKGPNLEVTFQDDFINLGLTTLEKLDEYIRNCNAVIHLVGDAVGAFAPEAAAQKLMEHYPDFLKRLPVLKETLANGFPRLSYTQWEAYLALYHEKRLHIYRPRPDAPRDATFQPKQEDKELQDQHFQRLCSIGRDRGEFANQERLSSHVLRDLRDLLPSREADSMH